MLDFRCYLKNIPTAVNASAIPTPGVNGFEQQIAQQGGQVGSMLIAPANLFIRKGGRQVVTLEK